MDPTDKPLVEKIVRAALREDLGAGDATTEALVPAAARAKGSIVYRGRGVVCGLAVAHMVFIKVDKRLIFRYEKEEGETVEAGTPVAVVIGKARAILKAERTALNLLQRLAGIATLTRAFVDRLGDVEIFDTRKTTPGLRVLEKYAVRTGGGRNHRADLSQVMVKDNHIAAAGEEAIEALLRQETRHVVAEAATVQTALRWAAIPCVKRILLDNMAADGIREAAAKIRAVNPRVTIEATGGITLENAEQLRGVGIDAISVGALTHSAPAVDIGLDLAKI